MTMRVILLALASLVLFNSCSEKYPQWTIEKTIDIGGGPIGIDVESNSIWISDGNNNRLNRYDDNWNLLESMDGFERPMHIAADKGSIYVPEYGSDRILKIMGGQKDSLLIELELDAPAGIDVVGDQVAIADFYSNSIIFGDGSSWKILGEKGDGPGQFHYPTDVQIFDDTLFVADAYNHRIQKLTLTGAHISTIGVAQEMNATTGIYITSNEIFATDLENDRVVVFDQNGQLLDMITEGFDKPTDLVLHNGKLLVLNYGSGEVVVLNQSK